MRLRYKAIPKWPYTVSNTGEVFSLKRSIHLKQKITMFGYKTVVLQNNKKKKHCFVHRLVASVFIKPHKPGMFVNHKNFDKQNNFVSNLEWVTTKENTIHAYRGGRYPCNKGENHSQNKLTNKQVKLIKKFLSRGETKASLLAKIFNVSQATISNIKNEKNWSHIKGEIK